MRVKKLHNEELNKLYCSTNIIRAIEWRRIGWACHVGCLEDRGLYRVWWGCVREKDHLEEPGVDGRIILRCIFREFVVVAWTGSRWHRVETGAGHL
jgi:hypothetical protein